MLKGLWYKFFHEQEEQLTKFPFKRGQFITLKKINPYKGCLKTGRLYCVKYCAYNQVVLRADNGTMGHFNASFFTLREPQGIAQNRGQKKGIRRPNNYKQALLDYEEVMQAQSLLENAIK